MAFRKRGIEVVVDTTRTAEFDLKSLRVVSDDETAIVRSLTEVSFSRSDVFSGDVRCRTIGDYDVAFLVTREGSTIVVTIFAVMRGGEAEKWKDFAIRVASSQLPEPIRIALKGRKDLK